jgi:hypothetical protein
MDAAWHWETHDAGVINDHHDNRERAEEVETGLAFAILETRIDGCRRQ